MAELPKGVRFEDLLKVKPAKDEHGTAFAVIYANDPAQRVFAGDNANFPAGSIIVREKRDTAEGDASSVIAMVKREPGFSQETDDWEFFAFEAKDLKLKTRETKGDCATCHAQADKTDWVFREHLK